MEVPPKYRDRTIARVVRAIIYDDNKRILMAKRARSDAAGKWALVGGKPENEETLEAAIIREVREELNLIFTPSFFCEVWTEEHSQANEVWHAVYFHGPFVGSVALDDTNSEFGFFALADLDKLEIAYDHEAVIGKFLTKL